MLRKSSILDAIEHISEETIEFKINDWLFFEVLLMEIHGRLSLSYATHIKREESTLKRQLTEKNKTA